MLDDSIADPKIKEEDIKNNIFVGKRLLKNSNDMSLIAKFVDSIYKDIFKELGYEEYADSIWTLPIIRK